MILETIRMVTAALDHPTYGVNQKLAALTTDNDDDSPPTVELVTDSTVHGDIARGRLPEITPCVAVSLYSAADLDGEVMTTVRDAVIEVLIRVGVDDIETEQGNRNTYYILRACQQSIRELNKNSNAADAVRNNIQLLECQKMRHETVWDTVNDVPVIGGLVVTYKVRDINP